MAVEETNANKAKQREICFTEGNVCNICLSLVHTVDVNTSKLLCRIRYYVLFSN